MKKGICFWLTTIVAIAWLIFGIVMMIGASETGLIWKVAKSNMTDYSAATAGQATRALNMLSGYVMIGTSFAYLVYLGNNPRITFPKWVKVLLGISGVIIPVAMFIIMSTMFNEQKELLMNTYAIPLVISNFGDWNSLCLMMGVSGTGLIIAGFLSRLYDKKKFIAPLILVLYALFTFLIIVGISALVYVWFGVMVIVVIIGLIFLTKSAYVPTRHNTYRINENGHERILTYYDTYNGHERYKDDIGYYWIKDNNSDTFYPDK